MAVSGKVIHPELSFKIIGAAFRVFNDVGYGMNEKYYQRVFAEVLRQEGIPFEKEKLVELDYRGQRLGRYFLDFLVDGKVVVELKVRPRFGYVHVKQTVGYLRATGLKLAILIYFTRDGVKYRRVVNAV